MVPSCWTRPPRLSFPASSITLKKGRGFNLFEAFHFANALFSQIFDIGIGWPDTGGRRSSPLFISRFSGNLIHACDTIFGYHRARNFAYMNLNADVTQKKQRTVNPLRVSSMAPVHRRLNINIAAWRRFHVSLARGRTVWSCPPMGVVESGFRLDGHLS